jgi:hypothetical protein
VEEKFAEIEQHILDATDLKENKLFLNHISATKGSLKNPISYAEFLNPKVSTLLDELKGTSTNVGVLIFDFVTDELARKTFEMNFI